MQKKNGSQENQELDSAIENDTNTENSNVINENNINESLNTEDLK